MNDLRVQYLALRKFFSRRDRLENPSEEIPPLGFLCA
jgi:hypothetical protein